MSIDDETVQVEQPAPAPVPVPAANGKASTRKATKTAKGEAVKAKPPKAAQPAKRTSAQPKANKGHKAAKATHKAAKKAKTAKARPRDPSKLDQFGYRLGSIRSKAAAMYASKKGATLQEVKAKVGSIQYNVLTELKERGNKLKKVPERNKSGGREVNRFFVQAR